MYISWLDNFKFNNIILFVLYIYIDILKTNKCYSLEQIKHIWKTLVVEQVPWMVLCFLHFLNQRW